MSVESAKAKFWRNPELVGTLLNFLDANSIQRLASCHNLAKEVSQTSLVWTKLAGRTCPDGRTNLHHIFRTRVTENKKKMAPLFDLVRMAEDPSEMKATLFQVISERFPHKKEEDGDRFEYADIDYTPYVKVCFSPDEHFSVCFMGFLLLEEVESRCRSHPNLVIDSFSFLELDQQMLTALSKRAARQKTKMKKAHVWGKGICGGTIWCENKTQAKALLTIVKNSEEVDFEVTMYIGDIKKQGWADLGKVADLHGKIDWRTFTLISKRDHMLEADRADLRKIWDAMWGDAFHGNTWTVTRGDRFDYWGNDEEFAKCGHNKEWRRLERVLDMTKVEWEKYKGEDISGSEDEDLDEELGWSSSEHEEGN